MNTKQIGKMGENAACEYMSKNGYNIVKRNFYTRYGEIDIILRKDEYTVFAEVKTRKYTSFGTPSEFVDKRKRERIIKSAVLYLGESETAIRFDVVEVMYKNDGEIVNINHIENAFWEE